MSAPTPPKAKPRAAKAVTPTKPKFEVIDDIFIYTAKSGDVVSIDFDFPADVMKAAVEGDKDDEEQFSVVAAWFGEDVQKTYAKMGALERIRFTKAFFAEFAKAVQIPLGESQSSSDS